MKNTMIWPLRSALARENVTSVRFTPVSMSSMHIRIAISDRRRVMPARPTENSAAPVTSARNTNGSPVVFISIHPSLREHHGAHDRDRKQHAHREEGQGVVREHHFRDHAHVPPRGL